MGSIEDFRRTERQADLLVGLAKLDDIECIEQGLGRHVDLWTTERFLIEGIAKIYGLDKL